MMFKVWEFRRITNNCEEFSAALEFSFHNLAPLLLKQGFDLIEFSFVLSIVDFEI